MKNSSKKRRIIDSDEEIEATPQPVKQNKKLALSKLKNIPDEKSKIKEVEQFFDDIPKRIERKKPIKKNDTSTKSHLFETDDDDFEKSISNIDETKLLKKEEKGNSDIQSNGTNKNEKSEKSNKTTPTKISSKDTNEKQDKVSGKVKSEEIKTPEKSKVKKEEQSPSTSKKESTPKNKSSLSELAFEEKTPINHKKVTEKTPKQESKSHKKSDHESSNFLLRPMINC